MSSGAFQRLADDQAEEAAIKGRATTPIREKPPHATLDVCKPIAALALSLLPLILARVSADFVPSAVSTAMNKAAIASAAMMFCSLIGYGVTVPVKLLAAFQHLAAGLLISSVAVELVPPIMQAPNDLKSNVAIVCGFVGGTVAFFALGAYCGAPEEDEESADAAPAEATPRTPRGITKLAHVRNAAGLAMPPYPGALVAAVAVDSAVDGLLIGLASASAEVANAGVVLAIALSIEMGFTGLAYAATLRKQPSMIGMLSVCAPPFVLLGASFFGAAAAAILTEFPAAHTMVLSFGATAVRVCTRTWTP